MHPPRCIVATYPNCSSSRRCSCRHSWICRDCDDHCRVFQTTMIYPRSSRAAQQCRSCLFIDLSGSGRYNPPVVLFWETRHALDAEKWCVTDAYHSSHPGRRIGFWHDGIPHHAAARIRRDGMGVFPGVIVAYCRVSARQTTRLASQTGRVARISATRYFLPISMIASSRGRCGTAA